VIILSKVLYSEATIGYESHCIGKQLLKLNDIQILNLKHLASHITKESTRNKKYLEFQFHSNSRAMLETQRAIKEDADLLRSHDIYRRASRAVHVN
ncbi:MAG: hypothetical protein SGPRY_009407, partial [Prymnesium sp.]